MGRLRKFAQNKVRSADRRVRFPVTIRHRNAKVKINTPGKHFPHYMLAYTVAGKRRMNTFHAARDAASRCWRLFLSLPQRRASSAGAIGRSRDGVSPHCCRHRAQRHQGSRGGVSPRKRATHQRRRKPKVTTLHQVCLGSGNPASKICRHVHQHRRL